MGVFRRNHLLCAAFYLYPYLIFKVSPLLFWEKLYPYQLAEDVLFLYAQR